MNNVIILCGISGSGKSTWAKKFIENNPSYVYVSSDKMRELVSGDESAQKDNGLVFELLEHMVGYLMLTNQNILIDATNYSFKNRKLWNKLAEKYNYNKCWTVFHTPLEICLENNGKRSRRVPEDVIIRQHNNFTFPLTEGGEIQHFRWE